MRSISLSSLSGPQVLSIHFVARVHVNVASQMPAVRTFDLSVSSHHPMEYSSCLRFGMRDTTREAHLVLTYYVWLDFHMIPELIRPSQPDVDGAQIIHRMH
jgi:hypothetical protein